MTIAHLDPKPLLFLTQSRYRWIFALTIGVAIYLCMRHPVLLGSFHTNGTQIATYLFKGLFIILAAWTAWCLVYTHSSFKEAFQKPHKYKTWVRIELIALFILPLLVKTQVGVAVNCDHSVAPPACIFGQIASAIVA